MWYTSVTVPNLRFAQIHEQGKQDGFVKKRDLPIQVSPQLAEILQSLKQNGSPGLVVGGAVRDAIMGLDPKDLDVEVYNITLDELTQILAQYGHVDLVGKSFGVLKLRTPDGQDFDFSVPRRDNKVGLGHKEFSVSFDPGITPDIAASRRDFTFNSMAFDPLSQELYDYYGGEKDLKNKVMRATSIAFAEDPLRVLRGMQFSSRMGFHVEPETAKLCQEMGKDFNTIPKERVWEEWKKLFLKGKDFHCVFDYLKSTGWDKFFPEVSNLVGVPQDPEWHPESSVEKHTAFVMQAAKSIADRENMSPDEKLLLMVSALSHDFGKASTTQLRDKDGKMRWTSHGHEAAGGPMAKEFLDRLGAPKKLIQQVIPLVERHLEHIRYKGDQSIGMIRSLAKDIAPASISQLGNLIEADHSGRPPLQPGLPEQAKAMIEEAKREGVHNGLPQPLITGKDILPYYDNKPGIHIGEAVQAANNAWLKGRFTTREEALNWLDNHLKGRASILKGQHILPYFGGKGGPYMQTIMNDAWKSQRNREFNDEPSADSWLQNYMTNYLAKNQPATEENTPEDLVE